MAGESTCKQIVTHGKDYLGYLVALRALQDVLNRGREYLLGYPDVVVVPGLLSPCELPDVQVNRGDFQQVVLFVG